MYLTYDDNLIFFIGLFLLVVILFIIFIPFLIVTPQIKIEQNNILLSSLQKQETKILKSQTIESRNFEETKFNSINEIQWKNEKIRIFQENILIIPEIQFSLKQWDMLNSNFINFKNEHKKNDNNYLIQSDILNFSENFKFNFEKENLKNIKEIFAYRSGTILAYGLFSLYKNVITINLVNPPRFFHNPNINKMKEVNISLDLYDFYTRMPMTNENLFFNGNIFIKNQL